jgi:hypothetical protein
MSGLLFWRTVESGLGKLVVAGGKKPRRQAARRASWTAKKEEQFIDTLTESCNVTLAAARARVSVSAAYRRRASDATFRRAWARAVSVGYAQLEMMLLERALHGVEKPVSAKAGESAVLRQYDDRTALALLRHHREGAAAAEQEVNSAEHEEAVERIIARLARLKERLEGAVETKSTRDGHAVLRWAVAFTVRRMVLRDGTSPGSGPPEDERKSEILAGL